MALTKKVTAKTRKTVLQVVEEFPLLYAKNNTDYQNVPLKKAALEKCSITLATKGIKLLGKEIADVVRNTKTMIAQHLAKRNSKTGAARDDLPYPPWWTESLFLRTTSGIRSQQSNTLGEEVVANQAWRQAPQVPSNVSTTGTDQSSASNHSVSVTPTTFRSHTKKTPSTRKRVQEWDKEISKAIDDVAGKLSDPYASYISMRISEIPIPGRYEVQAEILALLNSYYARTVKVTRSPRKPAAPKGKTAPKAPGHELMSALKDLPPLSFVNAPALSPSVAGCSHHLPQSNVQGPNTSVTASSKNAAIENLAPATETAALLIDNNNRTEATEPGIGEDDETDDSYLYTQIEEYYVSDEDL